MDSIIGTSQDNKCFEFCCVQVIRVPKDFPCLFINQYEKEALLPPGTIMKVKGFRKNKLVYLNRMSESTVEDLYQKEIKPEYQKEKIDPSDRKKWLRNICKEERSVAVIDLEIIGLDPELHDPLLQVIPF